MDHHGSQAALHKAQAEVHAASSIARPLQLLAQDVSPAAGDKAPEMCVLNHSDALVFSFYIFQICFSVKL